MTSRWFTEADGTRYRIDPDAGILTGEQAAQILTEADAAVARIEARNRGKTAAAARILVQEKREAAARAQVTRELADAGAYPYRASRADAGGPAALVHRIAPAPGPAGIAREICVKGEFTRCGCRDCTTPPAAPPDPGREIRAALAEFDTWALAGPVFPDWMEPGALVPEPGRCPECRLGYTAGKAGLCAHCQLVSRIARENLELAAAQPRTGSRDHSGWAVLAVMSVMMGAAAVLYHLPALCVPGFLLGLAAVLRRLR
jgi:hypothetical protein